MKNLNEQRTIRVRYIDHYNCIRPFQAKESNVTTSDRTDRKILGLYTLVVTS
jgi:hypothetical protein